MEELLQKVLQQQEEIILQLNALSEMLQKNSSPSVVSAERSATNLEIIISKYLRDLTVPANLKGYYYLRTAIIMAIENPNLRKRTIISIYYVIAEKYNTTPAKIERDIRYTIKRAWLRTSYELIENIFSYTSNSKKGIPTNAEFIFSIADHIQLHHLS